ncbi:transposase [Microbacterium sp. 22195]|uniref:transposase n=1 Tax=Microbacterium sp. 22195 TaxID=3453891 RepID=UPI003F85A81C
MTETLESVAADLCTTPLKGFVSERAARAEAVGDPDLSRRIRALRKPSVAAWVVNLFARERRDRLGQALQLAEELREAQADLDAGTLAELGRQRRALTDQLAREASGLAEDRGERVTASTLEAVRQTLSAAFFDPDAAAAVASGRLVRDLEPSEPVDLAAVVAGGPPERGAVAPRATDEVKARRERRDAERVVRDAEQELARARSEHGRAVRDRRDATARADRLAARVAELESELARLRDEADDAAEAVDATADKEARVAERMADAETALADALTALDRL